MTSPSRLLEEMHGATQDLYQCGFIDKKKMQEFDSLCQTSDVPNYTGEGVKALRSRLNVSQAVLASIINASPATVRAWEAGTKNPGGPCCKLLNLLERKGIAALC